MPRKPNKESSNNFARWLAIALENRGINLLELSRASNVSQSRLSELWNGTGHPRSETVIALASALVPAGADEQVKLALASTGLMAAGYLPEGSNVELTEDRHIQLSLAGQTPSRGAVTIGELATNPTTSVTASVDPKYQTSRNEIERHPIAQEIFQDMDVAQATNRLTPEKLARIKRFIQFELTDEDLGPPKPGEARDDYE